MSAVIFCAFAAVRTRRAARRDCIFCCLELPGQTKRSAPLEAVEVVTTGIPFTTAATIYATNGKVDKNPFRKENEKR